MRAAWSKHRDFHRLASSSIVQLCLTRVVDILYVSGILSLWTCLLDEGLIPLRAQEYLTAEFIKWIERRPEELCKYNYFCIWDSVCIVNVLENEKLRLPISITGTIVLILFRIHRIKKLVRLYHTYQLDRNRSNSNYFDLCKWWSFWRATCRLFNPVK